MGMPEGECRAICRCLFDVAENASSRTAPRGGGYATKKTEIAMRKTQKEWKRLLAASKFFLILPGMLTFPLERTQKNFHLCRGKGFSLCIFNYATWCLVHILNKYSHRKIPKASATLHTFSKCLKRLHLPLKLCGAADGWHR